MDDTRKLLAAEVYVDDLRHLAHTIDTCEDEIARLRARADGLKSMTNTDKVRASSDVHKLEEITNQILDMVKLYTVELNNYVYEYHIAHTVTDHISSKLHRDLIKRHYLSGARWDIVSVDLNYSYGRIMQLRQEALIMLYDAMPYHLQQECLKKAIPSAM